MPRGFPLSRAGGVEESRVALGVVDLEGATNLPITQSRCMRGNDGL